MLGEFYWLVEGRVLVVPFLETVTLEDVKDMNERTVRIAKEEGTGPMTHIISDSRERADLAPELKSVKHFKDIMPPDDDVLGWSIVVDPSPDFIMRFVANTVMQMRNRRFRVMHSMDEALQFLLHVDSTLPPTTVDQEKEA